MKNIFNPFLKKNLQKIAEVIGVYIPVTEKNAVNGVATLDHNMKLTASQLPDSVLGQVKYKGVWNANTNTPTLPTTPTAEHKASYYIVEAAGTFSGKSFEIGDWIIESGGQWTKVDNTDAVSTVFGRTGNVLPDASDYAAFYASLALANTFTQKQTAPQFESNIADGTPPLIVTSTTEVPNLRTSASSRMPVSNRQDANIYIGLNGITAFTTTTGSTNYPNVTGAGIRLERTGLQTLSDFILFRNGGNIDNTDFFIRMKSNSTTWFSNWFKFWHDGNHPRSLVTVSATEPASPQDGDFWIVP